MRLTPRAPLSVLATLTIAIGATSATSSALRAQSARSDIPAVQELFDLVAPRYSGEGALKTVAFLDQYWRHPGNTGFNAGIDRVVSILREAGYVEQSGAAAGSALTYRIESRAMSRPTWEPDSASVTIVGQTQPILRFATNRNMIAIHSFPTPAGGVEAAVVDAGKGSGAELDRANVTGKIVLADMSVGRLFAEAVQKRGALGVLAYALPAYTQPERNRTSIQFGSIARDDAKRGWGIALSFAAREALRSALARGPVRVRVAIATRSYESPERMVVADVHGSERAAERFVFSAHVQEPGANDNASGVATQAEMARVLGSLVREGAVRPKRTVTFLWGNEIGGTKWYLAQDAARTRGVLWGMSLDMVGEDTKQTGGTFLIEKMPDPSAVWTRGDDKHSEWGGEPLGIDRIVPHYFNDFVLRRCLERAAATGWVVRTNPFEGGSDHTPFLEAKKPGLLLWHFTDQFYHTDNDRLDKVSPVTMANVGISALVSALALTRADGASARAYVGELERAADARLDAELALGRAALAGARGDRAKEALILTTWGAYYRDAIRAAAEIEVGGASAATKQAIEAAARRVEAGANGRIARLG